MYHATASCISVLLFSFQALLTYHSIASSISVLLFSFQAYCRPCMVVDDKFCIVWLLGLLLRHHTCRCHHSKASHHRFAISHSASPYVFSIVSQRGMVLIIGSFVLVSEARKPAALFHGSRWATCIVSVEVQCYKIFLRVQRVLNSCNYQLCNCQCC